MKINIGSPRRIFRHLFVVLCLALTGFTLMATWLVAVRPEQTEASSHREAPLISGDPTVDNTDVYAFVSPDDKSKVTLIANWIPFEEPGGGPNFYHFDPNARYLIKIDKDGDAVADITYEWTFAKPMPVNPETFLYNTGPIAAAYESDMDFNLRQYYTVTRIINGGGTSVLFGNKLMPPDNIGPRSTPNYATIAANAVHTSGSIKEFTGQRQDPFFVDVGSVFDLLGLRPFNALHAVPGPTDTVGIDVLRGFNIHTTAIQVPISDLVQAGCTLNSGIPTTNVPACVIGIWSTAERRTTTTLSPGSVAASGDFVQVSRLGNPLVNEVVIDLARKDIFNAIPPTLDAAALDRVLTSEVASLMNTLYGSVLKPISTTGRSDLVTVFLTGIPGVTQQTGSMATPSEQLRLNTAIAPTAGICAGKRLGAMEDLPNTDLAAWPNGRRLEDDVVDIALRAVAQGYGPTFSQPPFNLPNLSPNNSLGDGVNTDDANCLSAFPYIGTPFPGYENNHGGFLRLLSDFLPLIQKN